MGISSMLEKSGFLRDALSLSGGTAIAQVIAVAALPLLTRMYTPDEFGVLALYIAVASLLSVFASMKLEQAIMLPKTDREAAGILVALLISSVVFALIILVAILLLRDRLLVWSGAQALKPWLYFLPLSIFLLGSYQGLRFWQMRQRNFSLVSAGLVSAILASTLVAIMIGAWGKAAFNGASGLVIGFICQGLVNVAILLKGVRQQKAHFSSINIVGIIQAVRPYQKLVSTLLFSNGIASGSMQLPVLTIGGVFGNSILGFYSMAERIISAPIALIANALGDVYRQRASVSWRESGSFNHLYWKTLLLTSVTGIPVFSVGILFAPDLFVFVLGEDWWVAGEYAQIMLVGGLFGFVTSPVDKGAVIVGAARFIILWNLARLVGIVLAIAATILFSLDIYLFVWLLTLNRVFIYLVNAWFEYGFASGVDKYV